MYISSFDGKRIFVRVWDEVESPRGVVQIVHGMAEHSGRYDAFARHLNEHGFIVVADDHRGHGRTDTETLGFSGDGMFAWTVIDESVITDHCRNTYHLPVILFGFSYGSFLTQSYLASFGDRIAAAVIGGSSYKKDFEVYLGSLVAGMGCIYHPEKPAKLIEKLSFGAYAKKFDDGEWLSVDAENNAAYRADPFCAFTCSRRFYKDFFKGLRSLYTKKYTARLPKKLPVLLVSGESDPVGNMGKGVKKLYRFYTEKAGMEDVSLVLFENSRHEFLNEKAGREQKWSTVVNFIEENCQGRPDGEGE